MFKLVAAICTMQDLGSTEYAVQYAERNPDGVARFSTRNLGGEQATLETVVTATTNLGVPAMFCTEYSIWVIMYDAPSTGRQAVGSKSEAKNLKWSWPAESRPKISSESNEANDALQVQTTQTSDLAIRLLVRLIFRTSSSHYTASVYDTEIPHAEYHDRTRMLGWSIAAAWLKGIDHEDSCSRNRLMAGGRRLPVATSTPRHHEQLHWGPKIHITMSQ
ncbi:hypothetical protein BO82DRAFT_366909 [Aspergillus uvarum CBS 121591]|uniref:Uncharacterized protein n=1 Tax=Aspergillus uvarum CBS 121591 TaxID=1448315 RepID=A0A319C634_9EURO|nr:hypothetical protein BO82DRAFT_366909 [Aspergillus uvarum CBS 121591]PYH79359.1 hypothetical protein BO82DRAFT_366909 [Aspergillus uvarum CBS 121591]